MKSVQNSKAFEIIKLVLRHLENETMELARRSLILKLTSIFSFLLLFSHILRNYLQIHFYTFLWGHVGFLFFTSLCTHQQKGQPLLFRCQHGSGLLAGGVRGRDRVTGQGLCAGMTVFLIPGSRACSFICLINHTVCACFYVRAHVCIP